MKRFGLIFPRFRYPSGDPPLGAAYLAAAVRSFTDWEVEVIDTTFFREPAARLAERIEQGRFDALGISFMTPMLRGARLAAAAAKRAQPGVPVIAGGPHPTVAPDHVLADKNFDMVVSGEGEITLSELLSRDLDPEGVEGVLFRRGDGVVRNAPRPPVQDLDSLPDPALDLFDMESYFKAWFLLDSVKPGLRGTSLLASRGCPYQCSYCQPTLEKLFGRKLRRRSPAGIVRELANLKDRFGANAFALQDDTFLIQKQWVLDVASALREARLGMLWECNLRANHVDEGVLAAMQEAGLRKVNIGIESATQRILDEVFQKRIDWDDVRRAVSVCKKLGLKIQGYFMIGAPSETFREVMRTISSASRLDLDDATFSITTPLPHTFLYDKTREGIHREFEDFDYYSTSVYRPGVTLRPRALFWLKRFAFVRFYLGPRRILKTLCTVLNPRNLSQTLVKLKRL